MVMRAIDPSDLGATRSRETESAALKQERGRIKELERELCRTDKALAETAALLMLSKNELGPATRMWREKLVALS
jgi:hypothetical protein